MTKNTVQFSIEPLENRDAPKTGDMVGGGSGIMSGWGEYKQTHDVKLAFGKAAKLV